MDFFAAAATSIGAVYLPAAVTLHTVLPTSSAINKAPVLSIANPTGRLMDRISRCRPQSSISSWSRHRANAFRPYR